MRAGSDWNAYATTTTSTTNPTADAARGVSVNKRGAEGFQLVTHGDLPKHVLFQVGTNITCGKKKKY